MSMPCTPMPLARLSGYNHRMDKEAIKGLLMAVGVALALLAVVGTDDGWHKLGCVMRALAREFALNIRSVCL
jgi:hypothetical protein